MCASIADSIECAKCMSTPYYTRHETAHCNTLSKKGPEFFARNEWAAADHFDVCHLPLLKNCWKPMTDWVWFSTFMLCRTAGKPVITLCWTFRCYGTAGHPVIMVCVCAGVVCKEYQCYDYIYSFLDFNVVYFFVDLVNKAHCAHPCEWDMALWKWLLLLLFTWRTKIDESL